VNGLTNVCSECGKGVQEAVSLPVVHDKEVVPLISQFMSVSDRFSFLWEWQKEAVRSEVLNSKAREFCNKGGLFRSGRRVSSLVSAHEGTIAV